MLSLVIADSEVELVPAEIARHPAILRQARRRRTDPERMLLDSNLHHRAMRGLPEGDRRGRPDIAHFCLLTALGSIPSREGDLSVHVHTRQNVVMSFDNRARLPRTQNRFYGLLEPLLADRVGTSLISYRQMGLVDLHEEISPDYTLGLSSRGERADLPSLMSCRDRLMVIVGGFPRGYYASPVDDISDRVVSFYPEPLDAWTAVSVAICAYSARSMT